jgi:hypothetical protein
MTQHIAVTTCNQAIWDDCGRRMAQTYLEYWPAKVPLWIYAEGFDPSSEVPNACCIDLEKTVPWQPLFERLYRGQQYNGGVDRRDYRRDAVRFSHKVATLGAATEILGAAYVEPYVSDDVLIWIDADVITHAPVTVDWLEGLFPEPATIAWVDRDRCYPECGFMMFRLPRAQKLIRRVVNAYRSGSIFQLPEWHDSYVIEHYVRSLRVPTHSLSGPEGRRHMGHPFINGPLAACLDHLKGETRRARGKSLPTDLMKPRSEPYWRC